MRSVTCKGKRRPARAGHACAREHSTNEGRLAPPRAQMALSQLSYGPTLLGLILVASMWPDMGVMRLASEPHMSLTSSSSDRDLRPLASTHSNLQRVHLPTQSNPEVSRPRSPHPHYNHECKREASKIACVFELATLICISIHVHFPSSICLCMHAHRCPRICCIFRCCSSASMRVTLAMRPEMSPTSPP